MVEVFWVVRVVVWNIHGMVDVMLSVLHWLNVSSVVIRMVQFVMGVVVNVMVNIMVRS